MMNQPKAIRAALYARVSSDKQADEGTIASQISALQDRLRQDGVLLEEELSFVDDGYSGTMLVRPALERLRDLAATGTIDRLYVHSPDRLARKYAYQVLLLDEFQRCSVEVVFLNHDIGRSPEDHLLVQVQGMVAEYERAKLLERCRRGKLHTARQGCVNALAAAPFGYRFVRKAEGGGVSRYDVVLEEARVVQQIFDWVGRERLSLAEVCRRLQQQGIRTRTGLRRWDRSTVCDMLKNPTYQGTAVYGRNRVGPRRPRLRPARGQPEQPRRPYSVYAADTPGITIAVPALVSRNSLRPSPSNWKKTACVIAAPNEALAGFCKACWSVPTVAMRSMGLAAVILWRMAALSKMPTTAASAAMDHVLAAHRSAIILRYRSAIWTPLFGKMSVNCFAIPPRSEMSTNAANSAPKVPNLPSRESICRNRFRISAKRSLA